MQSFDFTAALPDRTQSENTQRAYFRWIDRYLVDRADLKPTTGDNRLKRMEKLPVKSIQRHLTARKLNSWLEELAEQGSSRQSLDQARAALVTLAELMAQHDMMPTHTAAEIRAVSVPSVAKKQTPERLLNADQLRQIMQAARDMATSDNQMARNAVVATMLCTMALRREELSVAKWGDLTVSDGNVVLQIADDVVPVPRNVLSLIDRWRKAMSSGSREPAAGSPLVRRIWKGGRIAKDGLSPDGVWLIIRDAADAAGLGHVTPDDLRRSAVAGMWQAGVPLEEISRFLRHRNTLITERFIARLNR
ncbi:tyrosine-type recombinase/integrase [Phototrophicus methaneseepsis]|uniref:Tyrosine-type recombinase/integrase n=1 Tax=Phototrophicus methaneseepsis TaxID=2710758 RepID=A0A7S8EDR0_9CHLR|nr:tyrosine-type recombinase/integrase [Phototrophicus methaneseepsis]QPC85086.1 tyrosine-type recombinase/integrase [Phototrophicus methaneseepsis]